VTRFTVMTCKQHRQVWGDPYHLFEPKYLSILRDAIFSDISKDAETPRH
jgi:hypothetical protein